MDCISTRLSYRQTGAFTKLVQDYVDHSEKLTSFIAHPPTLDGIKKAIGSRKKFATNRELLVQELRKQYEIVEAAEAVKKNIDSLLSGDTFVITTAHQNNIFTGPLYFIYKIIHAIKLADHLTEALPGHKFVPVYYIGSEDADLDELNNISLDGEKIVWNTKQKGAVGRMKVDKDFLQLIDKIEGQLAVLSHGKETVELLRNSYSHLDDLQTATFKIVNALFAEYGLVVLLPDNANLKRQMIDVFEDDLLRQTASAIVENTSSKLGELYKVQAHPRDINLFYLQDDIRERIELKNNRYEVLNTKISFTKDQLLRELKNHPERFSPNVILRGLYQETILPGVAFIGGGGELSYWLELKNLFDHYKVPYPVQVLRNSFLIIEDKWKEKVEKLQLTVEDLFLPEQDLVNKLVKRDSDKKLRLNGTLTDTEKLYEAIKDQAASIDVTLGIHVESLKTITLHRLKELEKKMLRAEKRKFSDQQRQVEKIKMALFPNKGLQERRDNMLYYYAKWGQSFIKRLYEHSLNMEQEFVVLQVIDR
ncbi:bacillithiol biosynthesis cysteine-adding enzyme BshC [Terrimonas alba]|uniref:bacillithiol biosynthesis cysteine-adding enzyme BshC n=1 Tax=Terrimonas alba TaxID=3349636 RepID=UPI0035F4E01E